MAKRNLFYFLSIFFIIFLSIASVNARAHPPSGMTVDYNSSTDILTVDITHGVEDNTTHYVISVIVSVNGSIVQSHAYTSQPDIAFFTYEYTVVTNEGSTIKVTATCSEGGSLSRTLGGETPGGGIPGYIGLYLVLSISVITLLTLIRKKLKTV